MNLAKEIEALYNLVAKDETEDGLQRLLYICKQWDLPIRNEVISLSNQFYRLKKDSDELSDDLVHHFNITFLKFLDQIRLDEMLGMKSITQLIEDLTESRQIAVELEQKLWIAQKEIERLKRLNEK